MWNKKEVHWLHAGYNMWPWPLTSLMTLTYLKWQGSELIWFWADCMTLPFDHIHDLDLGVSRSESEIAVSQKCGGRLTWNEKDVCCGSSTHDHESMILTSVTMVGMADVPDIDGGDFRRRRAIDISSYFHWLHRDCAKCQPLAKMTFPFQCLICTIKHYAEFDVAL